MADRPLTDKATGRMKNIDRSPGMRFQETDREADFFSHEKRPASLFIGLSTGQRGQGWPGEHG